MEGAPSRIFHSPKSAVDRHGGVGSDMVYKQPIPLRRFFAVSDPRPKRASSAAFIFRPATNPDPNTTPPEPKVIDSVEYGDPGQIPASAQIYPRI